MHNEKHNYLRMGAKFIREKQGLEIENNVMFCGFQNNWIPKNTFDCFNGFRVTMKPPPYPCKFGVHLKVGLHNDYEPFSGVILDTNNSNRDQWKSYELPLSLM